MVPPQSVIGHLENFCDIALLLIPGHCWYLDKMKIFPKDSIAQFPVTFVGNLCHSTNYEYC